jgi:hypothetical protein
VHIIEDEVLAARYLKYFDKLRTNPSTKQLDASYKDWTVQSTPAPIEKFSGGMGPVFSPRANLDALDCYGELAGGAKIRPVHDRRLRHARDLQGRLRQERRCCDAGGRNAAPPIEVDRA